MSWNNRVVWSEGMFLRPQHFQQHDRYIETLVRGGVASVRSHFWGIKELRIDDAALTLGKIAITKLRGRLPDGTYVNIPDDDEAPLPMDVPDNTNESIVYISIPIHRREGTETDSTDNQESLARFLPQDYEVRNSIANTDQMARISVGGLRLRLMLESEDRGAYACLGIAKITEKRADDHIVLNENYIPPMLDSLATPKLNGYIKELVGLLHHRGDALAGRVTESGRGGTSEIADFMLLQAVNRYEPLLAHLSMSHDVHPETFYQLAITIAGELATFSGKTRRPVEFAAYQHDNLEMTYAPVIAELRRSLGTVLEQTAVGMELAAHKFGIHLATIKDRNLIGKAGYVLAARAQLPPDQLASRFPMQVKVGPVEQIKDLVNAGLPGISLRQLPVAPRQIPYHAGFTYFELDRNSDYWKKMSTSGAFAFHVGGDFPGLEMEFWAIKE